MQRWKGIDSTKYHSTSSQFEENFMMNWPMQHLEEILKEQKPAKKVVLPSSFTGGPRSLAQLYQDTMTIVRRFGKPDLFLTVTCNSAWPDIKMNFIHIKILRIDLTWLPVSKLKLSALMQEFVKSELFEKSYCICESDRVSKARITPFPHTNHSGGGGGGGMMQNQLRLKI